MASAMRGQRGSSTLGTDLASLHLNLSTGAAHWQTHGISGVEFPAFDARSQGPARLFAPCTVGKADAPYFNGVASIDAERGLSKHAGADHEERA